MLAGVVGLLGVPAHFVVRFVLPEPASRRALLGRAVRPAGRRALQAERVESLRVRTTIFVPSAQGVESVCAMVSAQDLSAKLGVPVISATVLDFACATADAASGDGDDNGSQPGLTEASQGVQGDAQAVVTDAAFPAYGYFAIGVPILALLAAGVTWQRYTYAMAALASGRSKRSSLRSTVMERVSRISNGRAAGLGKLAPPRGCSSSSTTDGAPFPLSIALANLLSTDAQIVESRALAHCADAAWAKRASRLSSASLTLPPSPVAGEGAAAACALVPVGAVLAGAARRRRTSSEERGARGERGADLNDVRADMDGASADGERKRAPLGLQLGGLFARQWDRYSLSLRSVFPSADGGGCDGPSGGVQRTTLDMVLSGEEPRSRALSGAAGARGRLRSPPTPANSSSGSDGASAMPWSSTPGDWSNEPGAEDLWPRKAALAVSAESIAIVSHRAAERTALAQRQQREGENEGEGEGAVAKVTRRETGARIDAPPLPGAAEVRTGAASGACDDALLPPRRSSAGSAQLRPAQPRGPSNAGGAPDGVAPRPQRVDAKEQGAQHSDNAAPPRDSGEHAQLQRLSHSSALLATMPPSPAPSSHRAPPPPPPTPSRPPTAPNAAHPLPPQHAAQRDVCAGGELPVLRALPRRLPAARAGMGGRTDAACADAPAAPSPRAAKAIEAEAAHVRTAAARAAIRSKEVKTVRAPSPAPAPVWRDGVLLNPPALQPMRDNSPIMRTRGPHVGAGGMQPTSSMFTTALGRSLHNFIGGNEHVAAVAADQADEARDAVRASSPPPSACSATPPAREREMSLAGDLGADARAEHALHGVPEDVLLQVSAGMGESIRAYRAAGEGGARSRRRSADARERAHWA